MAPLKNFMVVIALQFIANLPTEELSGWSTAREWIIVVLPGEELS